jgi:DNA-binding transcriptional ArsR family regulator
MQTELAIKCCAALAHPLRMKIFRTLVVAGHGGMVPGGLVETLSVSPTTLSFHLKELLLAEMISQERSSRNLVYRANFAQMDGLVAFLGESCCAGLSRSGADTEPPSPEPELVRIPAAALRRSAR